MRTLIRRALIRGRVDFPTIFAAVSPDEEGRMGPVDLRRGLRTLGVRGRRDLSSGVLTSGVHDSKCSGEKLPGKREVEHKIKLLA